MLVASGRVSSPNHGLMRKKIQEVYRQASTERFDCLILDLMLKLQIGQLPEATIEADVDCLRQVLFNLLDNAVKYTKPGGLVMVSGHGTDTEATVEVSDTGVGIPAESLPRVFDRFYRVDKSRSRQMGGTGLGLSICKALIERHGGRIEVESAVGKGSTFRIILPRGQSG